MGMFSHFSSCRKCGGIRSDAMHQLYKRLDAECTSDVAKEWMKLGQQLTAPPNPNPHNFKIIVICVLGEYTMLEVEYPDCKNYEGKKLLVYKGVSLSDIQNAKILDPHFCDNPDCMSPIARFEPTERGWEEATLYIRRMVWGT